MVRGLKMAPVFEDAFEGPFISLALVRTLTLVTLVKSRSDWVASLGRWPLDVNDPLKVLKKSN